MAALAIPIVILGSLYILSEQEKDEESELSKKYQKISYENFYNNENMNNNQNNNQNYTQNNKQNNKQNNNQNYNQNNNVEGFNNYNTRKLENFESNINLVNSYNNSNQHTDKFFVNRTNNVLSGENEKSNINLMNGQNIDMNSFKHNNMQPYFGGKIRGASNDLNITESILDNKQGYGSQSFSKSETAPLFKPEDNIHLANGTANNSDFFQSRMNESMKMSNVTLWEQQRVAPGLNLGYGSQNEQGFNTGGTQGSGGFNSAMTARETWMPKNVDDLRVDNNPKQTFDLLGHEGPLLNPIKQQGTIGKVEKHLPEKFYEGGPGRWFTTKGVEEAPPIRSTQVLPMENRIDTSTEYYGAGGQQAKTTYMNSNIEDSKRQSLESYPIINPTATRQNHANVNDHNVSSYKLLPNNRTTDRENTEMGGIFGIARAAIAPIVDILKPTRKENVIGNLRQTGNVNGLNPSGHIFNANDKTKTTNREMTTQKIDLNYVNVQSQNHRGDAYQVTQHQNYDNQRTTTNKEYIGGAISGGRGQKQYNAAYAQENNVNKTYELRPNQGNMSLYNNENNMQIKRDETLFNNNRTNVINGGTSVIPSTQFMGEINGIQTYDNTFNNSRMDSSLLSAFKNNPYTKSLSSVA